MYIFFLICTEWVLDKKTGDGWESKNSPFPSHSLPTKSWSESIQISILRTGSLTNLIYMPHSKVVPAPARLMPLLIIGPFRTQNGSRGGSWKGSTELAEKGQQPRVSQKCTTRRKSSSFSLNFYWVGGFFAWQWGQEKTAFWGVSPIQKEEKTQRRATAAKSGTRWPNEIGFTPKTISWKRF